MDLAQLQIQIRSEQVRAAETRLDKLDKTARRTEEGAARATRGFKTLDERSASLDNKFTRLVRSATFVVAALVGIAGARGAVTTITQIEQGLVGVAKTANLSNRELDQFGQRIKQLAVNVSTPIDKLLELGSVAGQLGIQGVSDLAKFTETIAKIEQAAPRLTGEEAAVGLARLLLLTNESVSTVDRLGAVIVNLGNNTATFEDQIIRASTFVGQSLASFRLSSDQVVALGTAIAESGQRAETGATALNRVFSSIERGASIGGDALRTFAEVANFSVEDFQKLADESTFAAVTEFLRGLGEHTANGENLLQLLTQLGIRGQEAARSLGALATRSDRLDFILALNARELENTISLEREFSRGADTLGSAIGRLQNAGKVLVDTYAGSSGVSAALRVTVEEITSAIRVLGGFGTASEEASVVTQTLAFGIEALIGTLLAAGALIAGRFIIAGIAPYITAMTTATTVTTAFNYAVLSTQATTTSAALTWTSLVAAIKVNPILSIAAVIGGAAAALGAFSRETSGAAREFVTLKGALDDGVPVLERMAEITAKLTRAQNESNYARQAEAIRDQIALLEEQADKIQQLSASGELPPGGIDVSRIVEIAPGFKDEADRITKEYQDFVKRIQDAVKDDPFSPLARGGQLQSVTLDSVEGTVTAEQALKALREEVVRLQGTLKEVQSAGGLPGALGLDGGGVDEVTNRAARDLEDMIIQLQQQLDVAQEPVEREKRIKGALQEVDALLFLANLTTEVQEARRAEIESLLRAIAAADEKNEKDRQTRESIKDAKEAQRDFLTSLQDTTEEIGLQEDALEELRLRREALTIASKRGTLGEYALLAIVDEHITKRRELRAALKAEEEATAALKKAQQEAATQLERDSQLLDQFNDRVSKAGRAIDRLTLTDSQATAASFLEPFIAQADELARLFGDEYPRVMEALANQAERLANIADVRRLASQLGGALHTALRGALEGQDDILQNLGRNVGFAIFDAFVDKFIVQQFVAKLTSDFADVAGNVADTQALQLSAQAAKATLASGGQEAGAYLVAYASQARAIMAGIGAGVPAAPAVSGAIQGAQAGAAGAASTSAAASSTTGAAAGAAAFNPYLALAIFALQFLETGGVLDRGESATLRNNRGRGMLVTQPTAIVGEGPNPEVVLPLSQDSRGRMGVEMATRLGNGNITQGVAPIGRLPSGNLGIRNFALGGFIGRSPSGGGPSLGGYGGQGTNVYGVGGPGLSGRGSGSPNSVINVYMGSSNDRRGARRTGRAVARSIQEYLG